MNKVILRLFESCNMQLFTNVWIGSFSERQCFKGHALCPRNYHKGLALSMSSHT